MKGDIESAVEILRKGGVLAVPTDTLYGLAASAFNVDAVERIFKIKGRPEDMAMPLLLASPDDLSQCAVDVPGYAWGLIDRFWPGALTLVLKRSDIVPDIVTAGRETVALRVPDHPVPRAIARELGGPITGTSANRNGKIGIAVAEDVRREFGDEIDLVVESDTPLVGVASTVLDLTSSVPAILRAGAVDIESIRAVCPQVTALSEPIIESLC
ncbi:MAG: threonylcarbamoyl-AMP synthase [Chloroflexi bacterium]|nr:threonylcarbamoyl-AMP synthase [Chloroflexota bacterium]